MSRPIKLYSKPLKGANSIILVLLILFNLIPCVLLVLMRFPVV